MALLLPLALANSRMLTPFKPFSAKSGVTAVIISVRQKCCLIWSPIKRLFFNLSCIQANSNQFVSDSFNQIPIFTLHRR
jgi:hypothetical protein